MSVKAKFFVSELKQTQWGTGSEKQEGVVLSAAHGPGNETWSKYTPSGRIEMQISNPAALAQFEIGKSYIVTFDQVTEAEAQ